MAEPVSFTRRSFAPPLLLFSLLCALFFTCGTLYGRHFPLMAIQFDVWFRTDINHYMHWVKAPSFVYRFPLHPATLLLLKPYCLLIGRFLPLDARLLPLFALPVVLFNAAVMTAALWLLTKDEPVSPFARLFAAAFTALLVGPLLVLAPIPESHTMGGVSLLMGAVLVYKSLHASGQSRHRYLRGVLFWGVAATGFSLSNIVPAVLVAFPLWRGFRLTRRQILGMALTAGAIGLLGLIQFVAKFTSERHTGNFLLFVFSRFDAWLHIPDVTAVERSLRALVMAQFGVPSPNRYLYTPADAPPYYGVVLRDAPNLLQIAAAVCWFVGILLWFLSARQRSVQSGERSLTMGCFFALSWLLAFHSCFASDEAYMFSVHAWPFALLPGLLAASASLRERAIFPSCLLGMTILLSLIQTCVAWPELLRLPV